ncbi:MAG: hypothetical protein M9894_12810 [Planctomycetes bacterium]|nr:hypothetical protein [Planctomycetota bacterium]
MADIKLRDLERAFRESGAASDEAAYLNEALRSGLMTPERLRLASYCGRPGASNVLGKKAPRRPDDPQAWLSGLWTEWGQEICTRFASLLAHQGLPTWEKAYPMETAPRLMLDLIDRLVDDGPLSPPPAEFRARFDTRNRYPYFMRDLGFNDKNSKIPRPARDAVGLVVCACNLIDDPDGAEEWLEDIADAQGFEDAVSALGAWAVGAMSPAAQSRGQKPPRKKPAPKKKPAAKKR